MSALNPGDQILTDSQLCHTGKFQSTELGKIASHYYVTYNSMMVYNQNLRSGMAMIELFRVFAGSSEFKLVPVSWLLLIRRLRMLTDFPLGSTRRES